MLDYKCTNAVETLQQEALHIREHILTIASRPEGTHLGGALSSVDILATLYFHVMRIRPEDPQWIDRDYFILSKGHSCAALYATLAQRGYFPVEELSSYAQPASRLNGHPTRKVPGVEFPTGSLGHGLSLGLGLALAARHDQRANRTFVLIGDGELQEGSVWEAAMAAPHFGLGNLVAIVDRNMLQITGLTEVQMRLEPLAERWRSFGWHAIECDGHDIVFLTKFFSSLAFEGTIPTVLIARTIKGKGINFLENRKQSHYVRLSAANYQKAWKALHVSALFDRKPTIESVEEE